MSSGLNLSILLAGMGTKVHCKSNTLGYYSMTDMNEDSTSSSWSPYYGDKSLLNGQYYNGMLHKTVREEYTGYEKDVLREKMIEHDTIFKNQVYTLSYICCLPCFLLTCAMGSVAALLCASFVHSFIYGS